MTLKQLVSGFKSELWLHEILALKHKRVSIVPSKKELRSLTSKLELALSQGRTKPALNWFSLGLFLDNAAILDVIRKKGSSRKCVPDLTTERGQDFRL